MTSFHPSGSLFLSHWLLFRPVILLYGHPFHDKILGMENLITIPLNISAEAADREYSLAVLAKHNGNRTRTAKILRISLRGLRNKINAWKSMGFYVTPPTIKRYDGT